MEYLRWLLTLALAAAAFLAYGEGKKVGRTDALAEYQAQGIEKLETVNGELIGQNAAILERVEDERTAREALAASIDKINLNAGSIGKQFKEALNASGMGLCKLSADVQRLRGESYEQARAAAAAANRARSGS